MKIITTLIIFIVGILQSCTFFDPSIQAPIGKPQTFVLEFSEAMDTQTALDSSNYTVISSLGDTIKIGKVAFIKKKLVDSTWVTLPMSTHIALYPKEPVYSGYYIIEIWDLEDEAGNVLDPNPTRIKVKYEPIYLKVE